MQVYRLCDKKEIDKIFKEKDYTSVGAPGKKYGKNKGEISYNTHTYNENEMYMHFFPNFKDLLYINLDKDMYICTYDIPEEILKQSIGIGEYAHPFNYKIMIKLVEYAIKSKEIKFNYLKSVDLLTESITYEDFLSGEPLDSYYKAFYPTPETNNIVK